MDLTTILALSFVCAMGAMSPGPSLAVVLRNTISGGRLQGIMTGVGHGLGFGIYALGFDKINWSVVGNIGLSLITSPAAPSTSTQSSQQGSSGMTSRVVIRCAVGVAF